MNDHFLKTKRGIIYYQTGGAGKPLFFLHGNGESSTIFEQQFADFTPTHFVIAMDTRGHGKSDMGVERLTFSQIVEDIMAILDDLEIKQTSFIGYSDGGNIALYFAAHFPERAASVVTMGANYEADAIEKVEYQKILAYRQRLLETEDTHQLNIVNLMLDEMNLSEEMLRSLSVPVLVMAGEYDLIKREHTEKMAEIIPHSELILVPNGGHDFFIANPHSLQEAIMTFEVKIE